MVFNILDEIVCLTITPGNVNDRVPVPDLMKGIMSKLIDDKGYLSQKLFQELFSNGVTLITKIRKNMKNCFMDIGDKLMLMKRSFIERIFSSLKSLNTVTHHRHISVVNAFIHLFAGLINYQLRANKPSLYSLTSLIPQPKLELKENGFPFRKIKKTDACFL